MKIKNACPCFSGKKYDQCCQPYHQGRLPENALLLMRSRYSAYALNNPEYIIETTHPENPQYQSDKLLWKQEISHFAIHSQYRDLKIHEFKETGHAATVTFTAFISHDGKDATFTEKSFFEKRQERWLYRDGQFVQRQERDA